MEDNEINTTDSSPNIVNKTSYFLYRPSHLDSNFLVFVIFISISQLFSSGLCHFTEADSPYMVFEYMEHGDLADLLRKNDPSLGADRHFDLKQVSLFLSLIIVFDIH